MGSKLLALKVLRARYYWPSIDRRCQGICKVLLYMPATHVLSCCPPPEELDTVNLSQLFDQWGLDLLGPFLLALSQLKYLIVAVDYFTK